MKYIKYHYWRSSGFVAQGLAIAIALLSKGINYVLYGTSLITVKPLIKVAKWFAITAADCHISAALTRYEPKTYE